MPSLIVLSFLFLFTQSIAKANDAVSQAAEYAKRGMTEIASDPPLMLLKNEKGKSRHEVSVNYIPLETDDDAILTGGAVAQENGEATGYGFGYGYSHSFKEKWAFILWLQAITVEKGNHTQKQGGAVTAKSIEFDALNANLALGVSYEFLRDSKNHTLNVFGGPSIMYLDFHTDVENFNTSGSLILSLDTFVTAVIPSVFAGVMYEYVAFEKWQIAPYALGVISVADECVDWEADRVSVNNNAQDGSATECDPSGSSTRGEVGVAPSFVSIGVKFNYKPWNLGFNISSMIRNAIMRPDKEDKAEVTGVNFALTKSWGDYD